jgi:hypothetical protein
MELPLMRTPPTVLAAALLALACSSPRQPAAEGGDAPAPQPGARPAAAAPFEVELRTISKHPTCMGNRRIKVDARGNVFHAVNQTECAEGQAWSTPYPATPVRTLSTDDQQRLLAVIRQSGFLALQPSYQADVDDGSIQEIDATVDGRTHSVRLDNTDQPAFAQVRQALIDAAD